MGEKTFGKLAVSMFICKSLEQFEASTVPIVEDCCRAGAVLAMKQWSLPVIVLGSSRCMAVDPAVAWPISYW